MKKWGFMIGGAVAVAGATAAVVFKLGSQDIMSDFEYQEAINVGNIYMDAGEYDTARSWFEMAIKIEPENASAYTHIVRTYLEQNEPEQAAEVLVIAWDKAEYSELLNSHYDMITMRYPEYEEKFENGEYELGSSVSEEEFEERFHQDEYEVVDQKGSFADEEREKEMKESLKVSLKKGGGGLFGSMGSGSSNGSSGSGSGNGGSVNGNAGNGNAGNGNSGSGSGNGGSGESGIGGIVIDGYEMGDSFGMDTGGMQGGAAIIANDMEIKADELLVYGIPVTQWTYSDFKKYVLSNCMTEAEWYRNESGGENNTYIMLDGEEAKAWVYVGPDRMGSGTEVVEINMQDGSGSCACRTWSENVTGKRYVVFDLLSGYEGKITDTGIVTGSYSALSGMSVKDAMNSLYNGLYEDLQKNSGQVYVRNGSITQFYESGEIHIVSNECSIVLRVNNDRISDLRVNVLLGNPMTP